MTQTAATKTTRKPRNAGGSRMAAWRAMREAYAAAHKRTLETLRKEG